MPPSAAQTPIQLFMVLMFLCGMMLVLGSFFILPICRAFVVGRATAIARRGQENDDSSMWHEIEIQLGIHTRKWWIFWALAVFLFVSLYYLALPPEQTEILFTVAGVVLGSIFLMVGYYLGLFCACLFWIGKTVRPWLLALTSLITGSLFFFAIYVLLGWAIPARFQTFVVEPGQIALTPLYVTTVLFILTSNLWRRAKNAGDDWFAGSPEDAIEAAHKALNLDGNSEVKSDQTSNDGSTDDSPNAH